MNMKPKITLNEEYRDLINRFYNLRIGRNLLNWPCFSNPQMSSHVCNIFAKLPGDHDCDYCEHLPYRECLVMCNIHHFCLAAYAARLNLQHTKGKGLAKTIVAILKKWKYPTLHKRVVGALDLLAGTKQAEVQIDNETTPNEESTMPELKEELPERLRSEETSETPQESVEPDPPEAEEPVVEESKSEPVAEEPKPESPIMPPMPTTINPPMMPPIPRLMLQQAASDMEVFHTIAQVAERFECSELTVGRFISVGGTTKSGEKVKLDFKKDGRRRLIPETSVVAFENAGIKRRKRSKTVE